MKTKLRISLKVGMSCVAALCFTNCTSGESFFSQSKTPTLLQLDPTTCGTSTQISCSDASTPILNQGQSAPITYATQADFGTLIYTILPGSTTVPADLGTMISTGENGGNYTAPASVPFSFDLKVYASTAERTLCGYCPVHVVASNSLGIPVDPNTNAIVGNVYNLPAYSGPGGADPATNPNFPYTPPDFATLTPVLTVNLPSIDIALQSWSVGFPGYPNLVEWFGIRFTATLTLPESGIYLFQTASDDGSRMYLDGQLVVDNTLPSDNWHQAYTVVTSAPMTMTAGPHVFQQDWIQGPRYQLGDIVSWQLPSGSAFVPIPSTAYSKP